MSPARVVRTPPPEQRASGLGLGPLGNLGVLAVVIIAGFWLIGEVDRFSRTETIDDVGAVGPIHLLADGRIVFAADGRIEALDPLSRQRAVLLEGVTEPVAGDVGPDGRVCALSRSAVVRCSAGPTVDLGSVVPPPIADDETASELAPAEPAGYDIVSDRRNGWFVTDSTRGLVLHIDATGDASVVATVRPDAFVPGQPLGLATDGDRVLVALGEMGYTTLRTGGLHKLISQGSWINGGSVSAVFPARYTVALSHVNDGGRMVNWITYRPGGPDAPYPDLVPGLEAPHGFVVLEDGRIAVADEGRLVIFRPTIDLRPPQ